MRAPRLTLLPLLAFLLGPHPAVRAQTTPPPVDPALRQRFGLLGPVVVKIGEGAALLTAGRWSKDETSSRAILGNGHRARLEAWAITREAEREDGARKIDIPLAGGIAGLALADVDGDGVNELFLHDLQGRLLVQSAAGDAVVPAVDVGRAATNGSLCVGDVDGDGRADALVLTEDGLRVVTHLAAEPKVGAPATLGGARPNAFQVTDLDGDGRVDVLVAVRTERMALRIKLAAAHGNHAFGPWLVLDPPSLQTAFPGTGAGGARIATIEGPHRRIVEYAVTRGADVDLPAAQLTSLPAVTGAAGRPFAHGDVDGDGDLDLVLAQPDRAELVFLLERDGEFEVQAAPSLAGITCVALGDVDGDGKLDVVVASPDEDALAWRSGALPITAFPVRLPVRDRPTAVAFDGDDILFLARNDRREATLYRLPRGGEPTKVSELGRMTGDPARLHVGQFDGAHGRDVAFVVPGVGLRTLFAQADGSLRGAEDVPGFTRRMDDGGLVQVASAAGDALLVVRERFARVVRFDAAGQPVVLEQDNGPAGSQALGLGAHGSAGVRLLLDPKGQKLYQQRGSAAARALPLPATGVTHLVAQGDQALLLCGDGVVRLSFAGGAGLRRVRSAEPPTVKSACYAGVSTDLDGDGQSDLLVLDSDLNGAHVFVAQGDQLARALSFPMFERAPSVRASIEPREFAVGDLDGDGRQDLAFLCHDRLLLYLTEQ